MNENGYIIGQEEIDLPQNFNELYIKVTINNLYVYEYTIIKDALTETSQIWYNGLGNNQINYIELYISKTKCKLNYAYFNNTNYTTTAKTEIWYR